MLWLFTICAGLNYLVGNNLLGLAFTVGQVFALASEVVDLLEE